MNYTKAHDYLQSLQNITRKEYLTNPKNCVDYLERLQFLLNILDNPEKKIPHYIHVTGTSGKGSVTLMLGSILKAAGKRTGTLTSPSPDGLLGRTAISGRVIDKKQFAELVFKIKRALSIYSRVSPYDTPSAFEVLTALALLYFAKKKVEWAVVEVGLGGRYDSTNVIPHKDVAVITNVGLDHTDILGNTKEKIAYEKAGIIKPGCIVFTAEKNKKVLQVIEAECRKNKSKISRITYHITHNNVKNKKSDTCYVLHATGFPPNGINFIYHSTPYHLPALGTHQIGNAILCINITRSLKIPQKAIERGLASVVLPIRMEVISKKPLVILDGAHNPDKMKTTVESIKTLKHENTRTIEQQNNPDAPVGIPTSHRDQTMKQYNNLHLIVGFSANKNIPAMIKQLTGLKPASIACTRFTLNKHREAAKPMDLSKQFKKLLPHTKIKNFLDPSEALIWSRGQQKKSGVLLVTGSMYLSGELRKNFRK